jgi:hypothetical protein
MPFIEINSKRILFIHIPKTGGTSVEKSMEKIEPLRMCLRTIPSIMRVPPEHMTMHDIEALLGEGYFDYAFAIVRNPYKRLESEYRMRNALSKEQFYTGLPPFPYWLEQNLAKARRDETYLANHLKPQVKFLGNNVKVFRYETGLRAILEQVRVDTGIDIPLVAERHLESSKEDVHIQWSMEALRMVEDLYERDFALLGYPKRLVPFFPIPSEDGIL